MASLDPVSPGAASRPGRDPRGNEGLGPFWDLDLHKDVDTTAWCKQFMNGLLMSAGFPLSQVDHTAWVQQLDA